MTLQGPGAEGVVSGPCGLSFACEVKLAVGCDPDYPQVERHIW
jgi:hypothetical protein